MKKNETLLTELFELDELTACQELAEKLMAEGAKSSAPYYYWVKVELEKESPNYLNAKRYLQLGQMSQDRIFLEKAQDFYALGLHEGALFFCEQANRHQLSVEGLRMQTKLYKVTGALDKVEDCLQEMAQFYPGMDIAAFSSSMEKNNPEDE